jgi:dihydrolipoamide dehydrogenase
MKKILILGGGPAGYVAAFRAARLGADVVVIEDRQIGGTCLNRGCIPTKALVASVQHLEHIRRAADYGIDLAGEARPDLARIMARKQAVTEQLRGGIEQLLKGHKIEVVRRRGKVAGPGSIELDDGGRLTGDAIIVCTGAEPARLPFLPDDPRIVTSDELVEIRELPRRLVIIGGGVIGSEFAAIFAGLGSQVTVVELLDQLLPGEDKRVGQSLQKAFRQKGISVHVRTSVEGVEPRPAGVLVRAGGLEIEADLVLQSVGRRPVSRGLGLEEADVQIDAAGNIVTDDALWTGVPGIFAAGDVAGPPQLAHWASHQGLIAAENAVTGSNLKHDRRVVPNCVFTDPEVASCGLTESRAAEAGIAIEVAHVRFNGNSKAVVDGDNEGFVRIVVAKEDGVVLGASMVGPHVTELIHEVALAAQNHLPLAALEHTIHAHPTLSEAVGEAVLSSVGKGMHTL